MPDTARLPGAWANPASRVVSPHARIHPDKDAYLRRLRRIEGQVRGIARVVDADVYRIDVRPRCRPPGPCRSVALGLLEDHLGACVMEAVRKADDEGAESVREAAAAVTTLVRS